MLQHVAGGRAPKEARRLKASRELGVVTSRVNVPHAFRRRVGLNFAVRRFKIEEKCYSRGLAGLSATDEELAKVALFKREWLRAGSKRLRRLGKSTTGECEEGKDKGCNGTDEGTREAWRPKGS